MQTGFDLDPDTCKSLVLGAGRQFPASWHVPWGPAVWSEVTNPTSVLPPPPPHMLSVASSSAPFSGLAPLHSRLNDEGKPRGDVTAKLLF